MSAETESREFLASLRNHELRNVLSKIHGDTLEARINRMSYHPGHFVRSKLMNGIMPIFSAIHLPPVQPFAVMDLHGGTREYWSPESRVYANTLLNRRADELRAIANSEVPPSAVAAASVLQPPPSLLPTDIQKRKVAIIQAFQSIADDVEKTSFTPAQSAGLSDSDVATIVRNLPYVLPLLDQSDVVEMIRFNGDVIEDYEAYIAQEQENELASGGFHPDVIITFQQQLVKLQRIQAVLTGYVKYADDDPNVRALRLDGLLKQTKLVSILPLKRKGKVTVVPPAPRSARRTAAEEAAARAGRPEGPGLQPAPPPAPRRQTIAEEAAAAARARRPGPPPPPEAAEAAAPADVADTRREVMQLFNAAQGRGADVTELRNLAIELGVDRAAAESKRSRNPLLTLIETTRPELAFLYRGNRAANGNILRDERP